MNCKMCGKELHPMDYAAWGQFCDEQCRSEFYHKEIRFIHKGFDTGGRLVTSNKEGVEILKLYKENDVEIIKQLYIKFKETVSNPTRWHLIAEGNVFEIGDWRMILSSGRSKAHGKYEPVITLSNISDFNNCIWLHGESEIDGMMQALENPL